MSKTLTTPRASRPAAPGVDERWTIADVERDTGLPKDTLRVWERRYGFPRPSRDEHGDRRYDADTMVRLRLLRRLLLAGHRPGRVVALPLPDLLKLLEEGVAQPDAGQATRQAGTESVGTGADPSADPNAVAGSTGPAASPGTGAAPPRAAFSAEMIRCLLRADLAAVRRLLQGELSRRGLSGLLVDVLGPTNTAIGEAWMAGRIGVAEEHLYTEAVQVHVRQALGALPEPTEPATPRVLLSTLPGEPHLLGLLMAEAILRLEGCGCWSLGGQTPIADLVGASAKVQADIVALSVTPVMRRRTLTAALAALDRALPARTALWVGGAGAHPDRHWPARVRCFSRLGEITEAVQRWRELAVG